MLQTQSSTIPVEQASEHVTLHCLDCNTDVALPRDTECQFRPHCPKCGSEIQLLCDHCGMRFAPKRWRFQDDGRPMNRFHSKTCGVEWRRKEKIREERQSREESEREAGLRLTLKEREVCRLDGAWEARRGILDRVVCRECGLFLKGHSLPDHLRNIHKMTSHDHRWKYPGAPIISCIEMAGSPRGSNDPHREARRLIQKYIRPEQLIEARSLSPEALAATIHKGLNLVEETIFDHVLCLVCGGKFSDNLAASHLAQKHGLTAREYQALYPGAPLRSARVNEDGRKRYKKLAEASNKAQRVLANIKRTQEPATSWRLKLMALLSEEGFKGKDLAVLVYPEVKDADVAERRLYPLRSRNKAQYESEAECVRTMSKAEREELKGTAVSELRKALA